MKKNGHSIPRVGSSNRVVGAGRLIAALDVGTTKVSCFIARVDEQNEIHVIGTGYRLSPGVRAGAVVDMEETESAIRAAVHQAEHLAGETIDEVVVNLTAGSPRTQIIEMDAEIEGHQISEAEAGHLLAAAAAKIDAADQEVVHAFPACYSIDGAIGVREPVGMFGDHLSVALHAVTCAPGPLRNLLACVEKAHLAASNVVLSPYAAAMATLVDDEKELGTACIDIGSGATSVAVFAGKSMIYSAIVPLGSGAITEDIARELLTPMDNAERIKVLYGSVLSSPSDEKETIEVARLGESEAEEGAMSSVPRSVVTGLIQARATEILEAAKGCLKASGFEGVAGRRVVLTGGGSQLTGLPELAQQVLDREVRIGRPRGIHGLAEATRGPGFATCVGLLAFAVRAPLEVREMQVAGAIGGIHLPEGKGITRVGKWLRENF